MPRAAPGTPRHSCRLSGFWVLAGRARPFGGSHNLAGVRVSAFVERVAEVTGRFCRPRAGSYTSGRVHRLESMIGSAARLGDFTPLLAELGGLIVSLIPFK